MKYKEKPKRIPVSEYAVHGFNKREEAAFKEIFYAMYTELVYVSTWMTDDFHESEDVVIRSFHKLWVSRRMYDNANHLIGSLYTIVKNESLNYLKSVANRTRKDNRLLTEELEEELADDIYDADKHEIFKLLQAHASKLTGQCGEVINLFLIGMPVRDISIKLHVSESTIYVQMHRGVNKLKKFFGVKENKDK